MSFWQIAALLFVGVAFGIVGTWTADATPPVTTLSATAVSQTVAPGEMLRVHYELDRARSCAVRLDRVLYDANRVRATLEDLDYAASPGAMGRDSYTVMVPVPRTFSQGPARYVVISSYQCNVMHRLWPIVTRAEVPFEVRGPPVSEGLPILVTPTR